MLSQVVCRSTCHTASTTLSCLHMQTSRKTPQPFETVQITIFLISFYQHVANTFETKTKKIKIQINNKNWKNLLVSIFMCIHSNTKYIFHQFYYNGLRFCRTVNNVHPTADSEYHDPFAFVFNRCDLPIINRLPHWCDLHFSAK